MTPSAEQAARRIADRLRAGAPYGIPRESLATYSLSNAIGSALQPHGSGFEAEVSQEIARHLQESGVRLQGGPNSIVVPPLAILGALDRQTVGSGAELAGFHRAAPVADALRPIPRVIEMGATVIEGKGPLRLVRVVGGVEPVWIDGDALGADQDLTDPTLDQDLAEVKTGMVSTGFTRTLGAQSEVRPLLERDVRLAAAGLVDQAALVGTGANGQPTGLLNKSGVSTVVTSGTLSWAKLLEAERVAHESGRMPGWVTSLGVRQVLRDTAELTSGTGRPAWRGGEVLDAPATVSGYLPDDPTGSFVYSSDWSHLVLLLSGVELVFDQFTRAARGHVLVRVFVYGAVGCWHTSMFVKCTDVTVEQVGS